MEYRTLGRTGWQISAVSMGAWAIGGSWGEVEDEESIAALHKAIDLGVNFLDTADVYGDGLSERLIGKLLKERPEQIYVATKAGRRIDPHVAEGYADREKMTAFIERSLKNLDVEALDLVQLHCPPTEVYYMPEVFGILDDLMQQGKILHYGVSVEKVEEALKAIEYPNVKTVQIIYNLFRQRPQDLFFREAERRNVGVIVRVPLASGLLTGKFDVDATFPENDHRNFNREGEAFDRGETFAGVDFETGVRTADQLKAYVPEGATMPQLALRWILMDEAVSCTIPGAKRPDQIAENVAAADLPPLPPRTMAAAHNLYETYIKPQVHQRW